MSYVLRTSRRRAHGSRGMNAFSSPLTNLRWQIVQTPGPHVVFRSVDGASTNCKGHLSLTHILDKLRVAIFRNDICNNDPQILLSCRWALIDLVPDTSCFRI